MKNEEKRKKSLLKEYEIEKETRFENKMIPIAPFRLSPKAKKSFNIH